MASDNTPLRLTKTGAVYRDFIEMNRLWSDQSDACIISQPDFIPMDPNDGTQPAIEPKISPVAPSRQT